MLLATNVALSVALVGVWKLMLACPGFPLKVRLLVQVMLE